MSAQAGLAAPRQRTARTLPFDRDALCPLAERLAQCAERMLDLHAESTQLIRITASVTLSGLPSHRRETVLLRIVEDLLIQLVSQAMHMRVQGRISLVLDTAAGGQMVLSVTHDGWNMEAPPAKGWLHDIGRLVRKHKGSMTLCRSTLSRITVLLPRENPYLEAEN